MQVDGSEQDCIGCELVSNDRGDFWAELSVSTIYEHFVTTQAKEASRWCHRFSRLQSPHG